MNSRAVLRRVLPYAAVDLGRRALHFGFARRCGICGAQVRRFLPQGYGHPVLERLQVVGGMYKAEDRCPVCHSGDRERLVQFYLDRHVLDPDGAGQGLSMLHLAPEKGLSLRLARTPGLRYVAGDIEPARYWHLKGVRKVDLLDIPMESGSVDLLICCHVLEHVPDDARAMREIRRVLSPRGRALLQTPLSLKRTETDDGDGTESVEERIRRFGQSDHVRLYAAEDYPRRLEAAGFSVERWDAFEEDAVAAAKLRLNPFELLHVCRPS